MSVKLRGTRYHYRFLMDGEDYHGPCPGCSIQTDFTQSQIEEVYQKALAFEEARRSAIREEKEKLRSADEDIRKNKTVRALVENYRYELTGGQPIRFEDAYALAVAKPSRHRALSRFASLRETYWKDFSAFMASVYPDVTDLSSVRRAHCEAYVRHLIDKGRFLRQVSYTVQKRRLSKTISYTNHYGISGKTIKGIVGACRWVFSRLEEDAGLVMDPWKNVVLPYQEPVSRDVFTPAELQLIWDGIQTDSFCRPLFMIAANSGLTEGDICCMKWADIDWVSGYFRTRRRKTGVRISLPLIPELAEYLRSLPKTSEYILPEHAEMYLRQQSCVSERVKNFLNRLGIVTTVAMEDRRAVSVKDLHSMRHVFCYRAKRAGIPESIIQKFVGHAVLSMTQHYADHDTDEDLRREMQKLPPLLLGETGAAVSPEDALRRKLAALIYTAPADRLDAALRVLTGAPALT